MNDFDDLDDLFGRLRSAATDGELAGETSHVDAMTRHHRRQKGHTMIEGQTMITSRRARVAAFVAAGVIGFGGVAAAGHGGPFDRTGSDDTTTSSGVTTTTSEVATTSSGATTTSEVTTTSSEVTTTSSEVTTTTSKVVEDDAPITRSVIEETVETEGDDEGRCLGKDPALFDNHGEFVSAVARNDVGFEGIEQRDAAQSPCGKDEVGESAVEVDDDSDDDDRDDDDSDDDSDDEDSDDDEHDDDSDDDDEHDDRPGKSGSQESEGNRGNGSSKHSDD